MGTFYRVLAIILFLSLTSCLDKNPNKEVEKSLDTRQISGNTTEMLHGDVNRKVYVPIYSEIYNRTKDTKNTINSYTEHSKYE